MHLRAIICVLLALLAAPGAAPAMADDVFTVTGIAVTGKDPDPAKAKISAFEQAQSKGFAELAARLAGERGAQFAVSLPPRDVGRLMESIKVEQESFGPGRYMATLTVAYRPDRVREVLTAQAIPFSEQASAPVLVIPLWQGKSDPQVWDDTPWRRAWKALAAKGGLTPVIIPLGDGEDSDAVSDSALAAASAASFQPLTQRYGTAAVILARAEPLPGGGGLHVMASGDLPAGPVTLDATITPDIAKGNDAASAEGARRVLAAITAAWQAAAPPPAPDQTATAAAPTTTAGDAATGSGEPVSIFNGLAEAKAAAATAPAPAPAPETPATAAPAPAVPAAPADPNALAPLTETVDQQALPDAAPASPAATAAAPIILTVKFASIDEWAELRRRISGVPGVTALEPSAVTEEGADVAVTYSGTADQLIAALAGQGLTVQKSGTQLVLAPL